MHNIQPLRGYYSVATISKKWSSLLTYQIAMCCIGYTQATRTVVISNRMSMHTSWATKYRALLAKYFTEDNTAFWFLPGEHKLVNSTLVLMGNVSNLTLHGIKAGNAQQCRVHRGTPATYSVVQTQCERCLIFYHRSSTSPATGSWDHSLEHHQFCSDVDSSRHQSTAGH